MIGSGLRSFLATFLVLAVSFAAGLGMLVRADMPKGAVAPAFIEARDRWLAGDDSALEALDLLAEQKNAAAMILLSKVGSLEMHKHFHASDAAHQKKRDRENWLSVATGYDRLARAIFFSNALPATAADLNETVAILLDYGETRRAFSLIGRATRTARQTDHYTPRLSPELVERLMGSEVPLAERFRFMGHDLKEHAGIERATVLSLQLCEEAINEGDLTPIKVLCSETDEARYQSMYRRFLGADVFEPDAWADEIIVNWVLAEHTSVATACRNACPGHLSECALFLFSLNAGFYGATGERSPAASLIPEKVFARSPRGQQYLWKTVSHFIPDDMSKYPEPLRSRFPSCLVEVAHGLPGARNSEDKP